MSKQSNPYEEFDPEPLLPCTMYSIQSHAKLEGVALQVLYKVTPNKRPVAEYQ